MAQTEIFISYRRDDSVREAEEIEERLEELQRGVFRDVSDIEIAEQFPSRIKNALSEAELRYCDYWKAMVKYF